MFRVLKHLEYRRLYLAQIVALLGTGLATVALGLLAYDVAGAKAGQVLGTALAIKMIAYVVVAPVANALVSGVSRRAVLVGADVLRLVMALSLPFVDQAWQVYVLIFVLQASSATFTPTFQSVIPDLLPDQDDYTNALSLSRLAYDLEAVVSPMLAAAVLLVVNSSTLFFGTAAGFAASALLVVSVAIPHRGPEPGQIRAAFGPRLWQGMALFVRRPALRPILALNLAVACAGAFVIVQTVVVVRSTFNLPEQAVAWLLGANGAGSMVAALLLPRVLRRVPEKVVMLGGAVALTCAISLVPLALASPTLLPGFAAIVVLWVAIGMAWSSVETPVGRVIRRNVDGSELSAAFAAQFSLQHACWLVTYPLAGWLGAVGLSGTAWGLAAMSALATGSAILWWPRVSSPPSVPSGVQDVAA